MPTANCHQHRKRRESRPLPLFLRVGADRGPQLRVVAVWLFLSVSVLVAAEASQVDPRQFLSELRRLGARKPFLTDSPDVYLEPRSLNQFFTDAIYRKLQGNAYFGYDYDEGFALERPAKAVQIEVLRELPASQSCLAAYRLALEQALAASGFAVKKTAPIQIGLCIVGVEPRETPKTLAGVMVEAYVRNASSQKSLFLRYGAGHLRGLAPAIRLSAEMLVAQTSARTKKP
ncbi:MAG: hypothetical protein L0387_38680 [Acidobacteria bacterium]|nr:hypothetical protein [Acidobacteriota bacterium]MCI0721676.1 hypothetical protein [Acidobacteriota bacterium]